MRIYYEIDEITDNCKNKCPFVNTGIKGETGTDCYVGSIACQECKFCYGQCKGQMSIVPKDKENFVLRNMPYIKCSKCYLKIPFWIKLQHIWYQFKLIFKK